MHELLKSNSYDIEIMSEVKKLLKAYIEPSMKKVNDKFIAFEEALISEKQTDLTYVTSMKMHMTIST